MSTNSFYYYDHDACAFVEVEPSRKGLWLKAGAVLCLSLMLSAVGVGVLYQMVVSPVEVAQADEIETLRGQLSSANARLASFSEELEDLAETDREIYRAVLNADPISADEFQMGVGGADDRRYSEFTAPTADLLTETSETFDRLERQLALQSRSYDELRGLADQRDAVLRQQPAIFPLKNARLTSGFGMRFHPILRVSRMHAGVDFPTPVGTELYATGDGRVSYVGTRGGYGNVVEIDHPLAGKMTRYATSRGPPRGSASGPRSRAARRSRTAATPGCPRRPTSTTRSAS